MFQLILLAFTAVAAIGPTNLLSIKEGIKHGAQHTFWIIFGGVLVDFFYASLANFGLSSLGSNTLFIVTLLSVGALVFAYLGAKGLKIALSKTEPQAATKKYHLPPLLLGIAMTLPNPFPILMWATALTSTGESYSWFTLLLIVLGVGGLWSAVEALMVKFFRPYIQPSLIRSIEAVTSIILLGFAVNFAWKVVELLYS